MNFIEPNFKPPVLLFVAHWDDESLITGGTLSKYGKGWDVIACTNKEHLPGEKKRFKRICKSAGANQYTLPIFHRMQRYKGENVLKFCKVSTKRKLDANVIRNGFKKKGIDPLKYNTVLTHNIDGDWGKHEHHKQIGRVARDVFKECDIYHFVIAQSLSSEKVEEYYRTNASHAVLLREEDILFKNRAIKKYKGGPLMWFGISNKEAFIINEISKKEN